MITIEATGLTDGSARGSLAVLTQPLSLWGGLDLESGVICDSTHPQAGLCLAGRVLAMTAARGSSSSSSALVEAIRRGTAPVAIVLVRPDPILLIGSLVAADLYGRETPVVTVRDRGWDALADGAEVLVESRAGRATLSIGERT